MTIDTRSRIEAKAAQVALGYVLIAVLALGLHACDGPASESKADLNVYVSIEPQKYFVERIGGEHVTVKVMVEPGASPATYEPKPEQLVKLSVADAYFRIRVSFEEAWMDRIAGVNKNMRVVDTTQGIERMPMVTHHHQGEGEKHKESEEEQEAENPDPHIWLSPGLVKIQARTIYGALAELDPEHKEDYHKNLEAFLADVDVLDGEIRETLAGVAEREFMVFHPAWGYFARDYGLEMIPIEIGGQEPSAAELARLISEAKERGIKVILAQPEFSTRSAETIAKEIGGKVLLISALAPDWLENLRQVATTFAEALSE